MLEEPRGLRLNKLGHHVTEDCSDSIESFVSRADIVKAIIVEQNLLHNEDGHCFAQLGSSLHDAQAERDDLRRQEKVDHL